MFEQIAEYSDFLKLDLRVGTIIKVEQFPQAKNPAYKLIIDFGPLGVKKSSAQICDLYDLDQILGRQIVAVVNFKPKQIANFISECLVLGSVDENKIVTLLSVERKVENGSKIS